VAITVVVVALLMIVFLVLCKKALEHSRDRRAEYLGRQARCRPSLPRPFALKGDTAFLEIPQFLVEFDERGPYLEVVTEEMRWKIRLEGIVLDTEVENPFEPDTAEHLLWLECLEATESSAGCDALLKELKK
jgi:hypothetical protein